MDGLHGLGEGGVAQVQAQLVQGEDAADAGDLVGAVAVVVRGGGEGSLHSLFGLQPEVAGGELRQGRALSLEGLGRRNR